MNLIISKCASSVNIWWNLVYLLRMAFGSFGSCWAVFVYYTFRLSFLLVTTLITTKTLLLIGFVIDFHTMTGMIL